MKVFVWHQIDKCSDNYHEDGGVVVFAESEARAREIAALSATTKRQTKYATYLAVARLFSSCRMLAVVDS